MRSPTHDALNIIEDTLRRPPERHDLGQCDRAIALARRLVVPTGGELVLASLLRRQHAHTGELRYLDELIDVSRRGLRAAPAAEIDAELRCGLAGALRTRFERTGSLADLNEAVQVAAPRDGAPRRAGRLALLSSVLAIRSEHIGSDQDLEAAIRVGRQAVEAVRPGDPDANSCFLNLSCALMVRFRRTGALPDLEEAIRFLERGIQVAPAGHPQRVDSFANLSIALRLCFERTGRGDYLDQAVDAARQAVAGAAHADKGALLTSLGNALVSRFKLTETRHDLDEATEVCRQAVEVTPANHHRRGKYLANLGDTLKIRQTLTGADEDLDEAIETSGLAVAGMPPDHPDHAAGLSTLGAALAARAENTGSEQDLDLATRHLAEASRAKAAPAATRIDAAHRFATIVASRQGLAAAVEAYTAAVDLLPLLAWRGIGLRDQQELLQRHAASLARDGAACAIAAGRPDLAVELLEAGRGVYWSQLLDTRTDLNGLRAVAPQLAEELHHCRTQLDQATTVDASMRAARRFDDLVERVRVLPPSAALPRPDRFLKAAPIRELLPGADDDPIVIVNISRWRCDVLIVTSDGVTQLALPDVTETQVAERVADYVGALQDSAETAIADVLSWLWDRIAEPVLTRLGHTGTPTGDWPRLWWCPTGVLTILPVHAAGDHHTRDTVLDRVVSSYTPTLRALAQARAREASTLPAKALVIALPETPGEAALPGAATERDLITAAFDPGRCTVLTAADATHDNILRQLGGHRWLHACCHGIQYPTDPVESGLVPYDWEAAGLIKITDMIGAGPAGGEFAFLSACETALGGATGLDEAISVAAAMWHAGWRHVIGTVWSVPDRSAAKVARSIYHDLVTDGILNAGAAAHALHHVVRTMRDASPDHVSRWAPFIHLGP